MKNSIFVSMVWLAACASTPPCSPEDEGDDTVGPTELPTPGPGGPTDPGASPGESDAAEYGYSRKLNGQVCACDLVEYQEGGCSTEKPKTCDPHIGWNIDTGECANPIAKDKPAEPQTSHICGEIYWCCAKVETVSADDGMQFKTTNFSDVPMCGNDRHEAYHKWHAALLAAFKVPFFHKKNDAVFPGAASLYSENCLTNPKGSGTCGWYPSGY